MHLIYRHASVFLSTVYFHFRHNWLCLYVNLVCFWQYYRNQMQRITKCAGNSSVHTQKKRMSEQHPNEMFKPHTNNVLLWLRSAVSHECNCTAELTFDVNFVLYNTLRRWHQNCNCNTIVSLRYDISSKADHGDILIVLLENQLRPTK